MSRAAAGRRGWWERFPGGSSGWADWGERARVATSGRLWWGAAALVLVLGGAAAGLHSPTSGAWFWHLADGEVIRAHGIGAGSAYLALHGAPLDLRAWVTDLGIYLIFQGGGPTGLAVASGLAGALLGLLLLLAIRRRPAALPLALVLAGGLGLGALGPALTDLPAELLALLAVLLLLALGATEGEGWWGEMAVLLVVLAWANLQADAAVAVLVVWGWVVVAHWEAGRPERARPPSWWLLPLCLVALCLSPQGLGAITALPLSLGMGGEHPLLAGWSSIDFHPWSARWAELSGLLLVLAYWLAGKRLRRTDAYLGLISAILALLWSSYLPWFLVVALVQSSWYLSLAWRDHGGSGEPRPITGANRRAAGAGAGIPVLAVVGVLLMSGSSVAGSGGPGAKLAARLPVRASSWLSTHPAPGAWLTTPQFGDYLSARFPSGGHVLCADDSLPLQGRPLASCERLTVLNRGAMATLRRLRARLAVLPRAAPAATFLLAEGWQIRYRDSTTVILAPRKL
ncbi:MAG: hypothetical protein ACREN1_11095 [Candidatus Dormibacteria bacterium]